MLPGPTRMVVHTSMRMPSGTLNLCANMTASCSGMAAQKVVDSLVMGVTEGIMTLWCCLQAVAHPVKRRRIDAAPAIPGRPLLQAFATATQPPVKAVAPAAKQQHKQSKQTSQVAATANASKQHASLAAKPGANGSSKHRAAGSSKAIPVSRKTRFHELLQEAGDGATAGNTAVAFAADMAKAHELRKKLKLRKVSVLTVVYNTFIRTVGECHLCE